MPAQWCRVEVVASKRGPTCPSLLWTTVACVQGRLSSATKWRCECRPSRRRVRPSAFWSTRERAGQQPTAGSQAAQMLLRASVAHNTHRLGYPPRTAPLAPR
jgi:hypothetical protein